MKKLLLSLALLLMASGTVYAANVGYYDMVVGQGDPGQTAAITAAGHTPVNIVDLSPAELAGIDVLLVQNPSNGIFGAEYLSALADIEAAVNSGMRLVIHDRLVTGAHTILPDGAGFTILRDSSDNANIDVLDDSTLVTNGPGGVVDNTTLDGGSSSSHGFTVAGTLPAGTAFILTRTNPDEIVTFSYPVGAGAVLYSSIPLDCYLGDGDCTFLAVTAGMEIYATNVVAYAVDGMATVGDIGYFRVTKTFSDMSEGDVEVTLTCNSGLPLTQSFTISGGGPGVTFVVTNLPESGADCAVTESSDHSDYNTVMNGDAGCEWEGFIGGFRTCAILNESKPAMYTVTPRTGSWTTTRMTKATTTST
jgi:hypothetical protein